MNIALIGYGKMGQIIEKIAIDRNHEIVLIIDENNRDSVTIEDLQKADIAIDFSTPHGVLDNIDFCMQAEVPVVVGTTGWYNQLDVIRERCETGGHTLMYGSNFSIGVNVFFHINKLLAKAMNPYKQYEVQVEEIHHTQKLDAPSGTAITIAEGILDNLDSKVNWVNNVVGESDESVPKHNELLIESHRLEDVPGTHTVLY